MVTELGLGAMNIPDVEEGGATLLRALELGINFVDTARVYRGSEFLVGTVLEEWRGEGVIVASKTTARSRDGVLADVERSLRHLRRDRVDLYQLHDVFAEDWERVMGPGGALEGLQEAQGQGLVGHIGLTSHTPQVLERAVRCGQFATVMLKVNPFEREPRYIVALAHEAGLGVIAMKPFGGLGMPATLKGLDSALDPPTMLHYCLSDPHLSVVIPGARSPGEVEELVDLALSYEPMTPQELARCDEEADRVSAQMAGPE